MKNLRIGSAQFKPHKQENTRCKRKKNKEIRTTTIDSLNSLDSYVLDSTKRTQILLGFLISGFDGSHYLFEPNREQHWIDNREKNEENALARGKTIFRSPRVTFQRCRARKSDGNLDIFKKVNPLTNCPYICVVMWECTSNKDGRRRFSSSSVALSELGRNEDVCLSFRDDVESNPHLRRGFVEPQRIQHARSLSATLSAHTIFLQFKNRKKISK